MKGDELEERGGGREGVIKEVMKERVRENEERDGPGWEEVESSLKGKRASEVQIFGALRGLGF